MKAPDAEHSVVVGSGLGDRRPVRERAARLGPDQVFAVVDEPLDLAERMAAGSPVPWIVLVNVATEHHIGPGRRWVEWARGWAADGYRVARIDQTGVGDSPVRPGQAEDLPFDPYWMVDVREVVRALRADGARVAMVGLCSGAYSSLEAAMWEHVDAVFTVNPRLTLWPAAKGTRAYTPHRRAGALPVKPVARLGREHRILAGAIWRIYREFAIWHAPLTMLWRAWRRRTALGVIACHDDAHHFTEVYALLPLFWWMRRSGRFEFRADDVVDHSLLGRRGQLFAHEHVTSFLHRHLALEAPRRPGRRRRGGRR